MESSINHLDQAVWVFTGKYEFEFEPLGGEPFTPEGFTSEGFTSEAVSSELHFKILNRQSLILILPSLPFVL